jgi:uncharacterized protein (DUF58 family)
VTDRPGTSSPAASPEALLRKLELTVSRRLDGLLQGDYRGLLPGPGTEPGEGRVYQAGDDVRLMDWSLTARTNVPHVRDAIADRELETWALVDLSASMDFGTARCQKRELVIAATAAAAFMTARAGNRFGAVVLRHGDARRLAAGTGRQATLALLHQVLTTPPAEEADRPTDLAGALDVLARAARRRGLAVVISDFLAPPGWERPLRALASRHEVLAVEVVDPRELELPNVGFLTLVDPETGARRSVQTARRGLRERYAAAAAGQRSAIAAEIRRAGADHLVLRTDRDWLLDVVRFVAARRRRRAAPRLDPAAPVASARRR